MENYFVTKIRIIHNGEERIMQFDKDNTNNFSKFIGGLLVILYRFPIDQRRKIWFYREKQWSFCRKGGLSWIITFCHDSHGFIQ